MEAEKRCPGTRNAVLTLNSWVGGKLLHMYTCLSKLICYDVVELTPSRSIESCNIISRSCRRLVVSSAFLRTRTARWTHSPLQKYVRESMCSHKYGFYTRNLGTKVLLAVELFAGVEKRHLRPQDLIHTGTTSLL